MAVLLVFPGGGASEGEWQLMTGCRPDMDPSGCGTRDSINITKNNKLRVVRRPTLGAIWCSRGAGRPASRILSALGLTLVFYVIGWLYRSLDLPMGWTRLSAGRSPPLSRSLEGVHTLLLYVGMPVQSPNYNKFLLLNKIY